MSDLSQKECVPCKGGVPPLKGGVLAGLASQLAPEWHVVNEHHLEREFKFPDFRAVWRSRTRSASWRNRSVIIPIFIWRGQSEIDVVDA